MAIAVARWGEAVLSDVRAYDSASTCDAAKAYCAFDPAEEEPVYCTVVSSSVFWAVLGTVEGTEYGKNMILADAGILSAIFGRG